MNIPTPYINDLIPCHSIDRTSGPHRRFVQVNDSPKPGRKFGDGPSEGARSIKERMERDAAAAQHAEQIQR